MTPTLRTKIEVSDGLAAWLGDGADKARASQDDALTTVLDALFAEGPGRAAAERAQKRLHQALAPAAYYDVAARTPIGPVYVVVGPRGLVAVRMGISLDDFMRQMGQALGALPARSPARAGAAARQVRDYLAGKRTSFDMPVDLSDMSDFQRTVLREAAAVPRGQVVTYTDIARRIGRPKAARAVGQALGRNPVPIVVPCHRVLASDGSLRGYSGGGGLETKAQLLALEGARLPA